MKIATATIGNATRTQSVGRARSRSRCGRFGCASDGGADCSGRATGVQLSGCRQRARLDTNLRAIMMPRRRRPSGRSNWWAVLAILAATNLLSAQETNGARVRAATRSYREHNEAAIVGEFARLLAVPN